MKVHNVGRIQQPNGRITPGLGQPTQAAGGSEGRSEGITQTERGTYR